ncbi:MULTISPECIES: DUF2922 domain-containing protein [Desulfofundulus]|uniref:DUF2922 domain-containing protein n=3 Tax=Desulfofundulus TaxID=2282741 RepID=A0A494WUH3_9FIRM|nr:MULTISPECIES: DUF2922 domain-containing protein [Desulfofundulus]AEG16844.1 hypothetical protein Desku_3360 [Desulfofundulus kuznetsovii DSM 6115]MDQ0285096.1 hypothetical protein [Desulfofundulus luciae]NHM28880.1 DUF2922 domain-containing protein [Desulfofundulus sp. TPOSR]RKO65762.1 DUF2922 domain-containing protein [Desulfofundulus salinum]
MAVTTTQTLRMVFKNQSGSNFTISLDNPRDNVTAAEIEAVMDLIISRNVFLTGGGALVSKQDVQIVDRTTNDLYDPA